MRVGQPQVRHVADQTTLMTGPEILHGAILLVSHYGLDSTGGILLMLIHQCHEPGVLFHVCGGRLNRGYDPVLVVHRTVMLVPSP